MTGKKDASQQMANLTEALIEDLMRASDKELLEEVREDGGDADALSGKVAALVIGAVAKHGKATLTHAREALAAARAQRSATPVAAVLSLEDKRRIVNRFAAKDTQLKDKLTIAARSGHEPTESDLDSMLQELLDLGVIDEDGTER